MSLGNGAWKNGGAREKTKPSMKDIHDNPVSENHHRLRHREKPVETKDTYHILKAKGGWFGWEKS